MNNPWDLFGAYEEGRNRAIAAKKLRFMDDYANALMQPIPQPNLVQDVAVPQNPVPISNMGPLGSLTSPTFGDQEPAPITTRGWGEGLFPSEPMSILEQSRNALENPPPPPDNEPPRNPFEMGPSYDIATGDTQKWGFIQPPDVIETQSIPQPDLIPLIEHGKKYGLPEEVIRKSPAAALEYTQTKDAERKKLKETMITKLFDNAILNGDNEMAQQVLAYALKDSDLSDLAQSLGAIKIHGKNEFSSTSPLSSEQLQSLLHEAADPFLASQIKSATPGLTYEVKKKNGRVVEFKQVKDINAEKDYTGNARIVFDALKTRLGRSPNGEEMRAAMLDYDKEVAAAGAAGRYPYTVAAQYDSGYKFTDYTPEEKEFWFQKTLLNPNDIPKFGIRDNESRTQYPREFANWARSNGYTGAAAAAEAADRKAKESALRDLEKREQLITTFTNRIDANIKLYEEKQQTFGQPKFNKLMNSAINLWRRGVSGSGDLASLTQILFSISSEVGKVEAGNIGIAGVTEGVRQIQGKMHDEDLNPDEIKKVLQMSKDLSATARAAMKFQKDDLKKSMLGLGKSKPKAQPLTSLPPATPANKGKRIRETKSDGTVIIHTSTGTDWTHQAEGKK